MSRIRPKWETLLVSRCQYPHVITVYAVDDYFNLGFYREVVDRPWLRWFGITYEKRVQKAIRKCEEWCERENRL
jgi:hypothetical protein